MSMVQSSSIFLRSLRFHAFHGVMEQERTVGNDYLVDVRIGCQLAKAMESDDVNDTVNYAEVYGVIREEMRQPSRLLENVVGRIGRRLLDEFPMIETLDLKLTKVNPPMGADCDGAGVEACFRR